MMIKEQEVFSLKENPLYSLRSFRYSCPSGGSLTNVRLQKMEQKKTLKNKGGRPRKKILRESLVGCYVTTSEKVVISAKAEQAGLKVSDYLRDCALGKKIEPGRSTEELEALRNLPGLANNLNQLTKLAHQGGLERMSVKLLRILNELSDKLDRL